MKSEATCEELAESLALRGTGWLSPEEAARVDDHVAKCAACAAELRRERRLEKLLRAVPLEPASPPAIFSPAVRRRATAPLALGLAAAGLVAILLLRHPAAPPAATPGHTVVETNASETGPRAVDAWLMVAAPGGDPNRGLLLAHQAAGGVGR